jgi:hypothetical protein
LIHLAVEGALLDAYSHAKTRNGSSPEPAFFDFWMHGKYPTFRPTSCSESLRRGLSGFFLVLNNYLIVLLKKFLDLVINQRFRAACFGTSPAPEELFTSPMFSVPFRPPALNGLSGVFPASGECSGAAFSNPCAR